MHNPWVNNTLIPSATDASMMIARQVFGPRASWFPLIQSAAYTPSNVTTDRTFDANATTTDELADVVGTLIADLQVQRKLT